MVVEESEIRIAITADDLGVKYRSAAPAPRAPILKRDRGWSPARALQLNATMAAAWVLLAGVGCAELNLGEAKWFCRKRAVQREIPNILSTPQANFWRFNNQKRVDEDSLNLGSTTSDVSVITAPLTDEVNGRPGGEGWVLASGSAAGRGNLRSTQSASIGSIDRSAGLTLAMWFFAPKTWQSEAEEGAQPQVLLSLVPAVDAKRDSASSWQSLASCDGANVKAPNAIAYELVLDQSGNLGLAQPNEDANGPTWKCLTPVERKGNIVSYGLGKWHHAAAVISPNSARATLYLDGDKVGAVDLPTSAATQSQNSSLVFGSEPESGLAFNGYLDDVALVRRALSEEEIGQLRSHSLAKYDFDGSMWSTWNSPRSKATWYAMQSYGVGATCLDGKSGGCGLVAQFAPDQLEKKNIALLDEVVFDGDLPEGKVSDLTLMDASGEQFCKWTVAGKGGAEYHLSMRKRANPSDIGDSSSVHELKWCKCNQCDCNFDIATFYIGSTWTLGVGAYSFLACGVRLKFFDEDASATDPNEFQWSRGMMDGSAQGNCWRPISYDAGSHAAFSKAPGAGVVVASLSGPGSSTAQIGVELVKATDASGGKDAPAAANVSNGVNHPTLSDDKFVQICANLPAHLGERLPGEDSASYQIILKNSNDAYCQITVAGRDTRDDGWSIYPDPERPLDMTNLTQLNKKVCDHFSELNNPILDDDGNTLEFSVDDDVAFLGVQKQWAAEVPEPAVVKIRSFTLGDGQLDCPTGGTSNSSSSSGGTSDADGSSSGGSSNSNGPNI